MPKQKTFLKPSKKKSKHAPTAPETADEYLEMGVDFEEAGEKWRGGDAAKSARFFVKAIDCYDEGLGKFPGSFDLAYNKARVQYEMTQHPKLKKQLPGSLLDLLRTALFSSRYALSLDGANSDALFNTAQVLTSIVEELPKNSPESSALLEEVLQLFEQCLAYQEKEKLDFDNQALAAQAMMANDSNMISAEGSDDEQGGVSLSPETSATSMDVDDKELPPPQDNRYARIIEPITNDHILDTILAQLEALTQLCSMLGSANEETMTWIEGYAKGLTEIKLDFYTNGTGRTAEAALSLATYTCALTNLQLLSSLTTPEAYIITVTSAFGTLSLSSSPEGLCAYGEALLAFNATLRTNPKYSQRTYLSSRWDALALALKNFTAASKIPNVSNLAKIHTARGDCEVLRYQLGQEEVMFEVARENGAILLRNAGKFYAGAKGIAKSEGENEEEFEATMKEALVQALKGEPGALLVGEKEAGNSVLAVREMVDDGLVTSKQLAGMGIYGD